MTKDEIQNLRVGDQIQYTYESVNGKPLSSAVWHGPCPVVDIFARGTDSKGFAYVCFYLELKSGSRMSGSVSEGDLFYRLVKNDSHIYS